MLHDQAEYSLDGRFPGTLVAFRFNRGDIMDYAGLLERAMKGAGLVRAGKSDDISFE